MIETILVDDDFLVRSYLKQLDAWGKEGFRIISDVRDGEEALEAIQRQRPDILVTDITMPLMDGIELIRKIRETDEEMYIIVLSCHDDFEYVKEAMKLGANEYILKNSLDESTLTEILRNVKGQLSRNEIKQSQKQQKEKLQKLGSRSLKFAYFNQLLAGSMEREERSEKAKEAGIHGEYKNSAVISMSILEYPVLKENSTILEMEQYSQLLIGHLTTQLETLLGEESQYVEMIYLGEGVFCCFLDLSMFHRSSLLRQRLTAAASGCYRCCKEEEYEFVIGVSNICMGEEGIRQAYLQAREMLKLGFYQNEEILYYENGIQVTHELPKEAQLLIRNITTYMLQKQYETLEKEFQLVLERCQETKVEGKLVVQWLRELDTKAGIQRDIKEYSTFTSIKAVAAGKQAYQQKLLYTPKAGRPESNNGSIKKAVEYIHEHYQEAMGLDDVAAAVGLNSAYLSYLFKQEMGVGFSNYLLECRMDCAKGLLKSSNYKVKDVAAQAGFHDYHYFSKAFKKTIGVSPADYRRE